MRTKRNLVILLAVAFVAAVLFSIYFLFTVSTIVPTYTVAENTSVSGINEKVFESKGKNILFVKLDEIKDKIEEDPYMEVTSIEKVYPNTIKVSIKERREVYNLEIDENIYKLDANGYVLSCESKDTFGGQTRDKIELRLEGVQIVSKEFGEKLLTDDNELFYELLEQVKNVDLSDCIKTLTVDKKIAGENFLSFATYTGVNIKVYQPQDSGSEKIATAFALYNDENSEVLGDYLKMFDTIIVYKNDSGEIKATWTSHNV